MYRCNRKWKNIYDKGNFRKKKEKKFLLNYKVFIGSRAIIKNNITIGEGSIIGAGLYIKKNLNKNTLKKNE